MAVSPRVNGSSAQVRSKPLCAAFDCRNSRAGSLISTSSRTGVDSPVGLSDDGAVAHCTRPEHAGMLEQNPNSETFPHRLQGECACGARHGQRDGWGEPEAVYPYKDREGRPLRGRPLSRQALPAAPTGPGPVQPLHLEPGRLERVLYRLDELWAAYEQGVDTLHIAEGEKDVEAIFANGGIATCNPGGAGKWRPEYSQQLPPFTRILVVADEDEKGRQHARDVARSLKASPEASRPSGRSRVRTSTTTWVPATRSKCSSHGPSCSRTRRMRSPPASRTRGSRSTSSRSRALRRSRRLSARSSTPTARTSLEGARGPQVLASQRSLRARDPGETQGGTGGRDAPSALATTAGTETPRQLRDTE